MHLIVSIRLSPHFFAFSCRYCRVVDLRSACEVGEHSCIYFFAFLCSGCNLVCRRSKYWRRSAALWGSKPPDFCRHHFRVRYQIYAAEYSYFSCRNTRSAGKLRVTENFLGHWHSIVLKTVRDSGTSDTVTLLVKVKCPGMRVVSCYLCPRHSSGKVRVVVSDSLSKFLGGNYFAVRAAVIEKGSECGNGATRIVATRNVAAGNREEPKSDGH